MHGLQVVQTRRALAFDFHGVRSCSSRRSTTDVERTHRQLCAWLTDRLSRDDTDRFAHVDAMTTRQVTAVALRANAVASLASDRRTYLDLINAFLLEQLHQAFIDQRSRRHDDRRNIAWLRDVFGDHATQHALTQTFDDVTAFDDRIHHQTVDRST